jgi:hypothetical protein
MLVLAHLNLEGAVRVQVKGLGLLQLKAVQVCHLFATDRQSHQRIDSNFLQVYSLEQVWMVPIFFEAL